MAEQQNSDDFEILYTPEETLQIEVERLTTIINGFDSVKDQNKLQNEKIKQLEQKLATKEELQTVMEKKLQNLLNKEEQNAKDHSNQINAITKKLQENENICKIQFETITGQQQKFAKNDTEQAQLQQQIAQFKILTGKLEEKLLAIEKQNKTLTKNYEQKIKQNDDLTKQAVEKEKQTYLDFQKKTEQMINQHEETIRKLKNEISQLSSTILIQKDSGYQQTESLKKENQDQNLHIQHLKKENSELHLQINNLKKENQDQKDLINQILENAKKDSQNAQSELQKKENQFKQKENDLLQQIQLLNNKQKDQNQNQQNQQMIQFYVNENQGLSKQIQDLKDEILSRDYLLNNFDIETLLQKVIDQIEKDILDNQIKKQEKQQLIFSEINKILQTIKQSMSNQKIRVDFQLQNIN